MVVRKTSCGVGILGEFTPNTVGRRHEAAEEAIEFCPDFTLGLKPYTNLTRQPREAPSIVLSEFTGALFPHITFIIQFYAIDPLTLKYSTPSVTILKISMVEYPSQI